MNQTLKQAPEHRVEFYNRKDHKQYNKLLPGECTIFRNDVGKYIAFKEKNNTLNVYPYHNE